MPSANSWSRLPTAAFDQVHPGYGGATPSFAEIRFGIHDEMIPSRRSLRESIVLAGLHVRGTQLKINPEKTWKTGPRNPHSARQPPLISVQVRLSTVHSELAAAGHPASRAGYRGRLVTWMRNRKNTPEWLSGFGGMGTTLKYKPSKT